MAEAPPLFAAALEHLESAARHKDLADFDVLRTPFSALEPFVLASLQGPFDAARPAHQAVALGLAALLAERLAAAHGSFWFPSREAPFGAAVGFPKTFLALSPYALVVEALRAEGAAALDARQAELAASLSQHGDGAAPDGARLSAARYRALLDPEFLLFLVVDRRRLDEALAIPAAAAAEALREAIAAAPLEVTQKEELDDAWVRPLLALDAEQALGAQVARAPRAVERFCRLWAGSACTAPASEAFWADVAFPMVAKGAPRDEPRLLGVFPPAAARPLVPQLPPNAPARLYAIDAAPLRAPLAALESTGRDRPAGEAEELLAIARARLAELRALLKNLALGPFELAFLRLPEADLPQEALARDVSASFAAGP
jgi:hypothetical protein